MGQDSPWIGDLLGALGAAGLGSNIYASYEQKGRVIPTHASPLFPDPML